MGRRWKQRLANIDTTPSQPTKTVKMIEHSISPYPVTSTNYYQNNQTRKVTMNKEEYEAYLIQAASRGYKLGVKVETNYNAKATITDIKVVGDKGIDIWGEGKPGPDCFLITPESTGNQNGCGYNESELNIIKE